MLELDQVYAVEAREGLRQLEPSSVDCVMTSPPYWRARDYGVPAVLWKDGSDVPLGREPDPDSYVRHLCVVFDEVWRVLKDSGTLWINLDDVCRMSGRDAPIRSGGSSTARERPCSPSTHPPEKCLCLIPERFCLAMVRRGWILRNKIVWHKPNHMPSSVKDRLARSWETVLFFVKSSRYHFALDAIREPSAASQRVLRVTTRPRRPALDGSEGRRPPGHDEPGGLHPLGRNPGDCWSITVRAGFESHSAVYPPALCHRPIAAGCPVGGLVVDPFAGSGTTLLVARSLGRRFIGFDADSRSVESARRRLAAPIGEHMHREDGSVGTPQVPREAA